MLVSETYSNNYRAEDFKGQPPRVWTVKNVTEEKMPVDAQTGKSATKFRLEFLEERRGIILNKTNATYIAALFGDDTGGWLGQKLEFFFDPTAKGFSGKLGGIGIRLPSGARKS